MLVVTEDADSYYDCYTKAEAFCKVQLTVYLPSLFLFLNSGPGKEISQILPSA